MRRTAAWLRRTANRLDHTSAVYNVRDYGARCDYKHDDTRAFQRAFKAAKGRPLFTFPNGTRTASPDTSN